MSPEMRNRVMAESQRAQQQNAQLDYSRGVLAKIRMADRAEDVLPGYEEVLGPLAKQVERFIQNPELGDQGFKIVQAAEKALDDLLTEQRNDKLRRANADDFEAWGLAQAGANPTHQRIAREMAELNRQGYIKTAGEARGKFLAKIDPEAFGAGQQASAEGRAQERLQSLYTQAARDLTTRGPMGEVMQPTRAEIEERVALMMAPAGGPEEQQQRGTTAGGRRTAVTAGARAAVEPGPGPKEQAAPPARGAPSDPEQAWRFMPPEELGALSDEEFAALEQRAQAVGGPREETRKRVMGTLDPTKKKPKSKKDK
jgi:hypothetical protein